MKVEFHRHNIDKQDINNANDVLRSLFLTTGTVTDQFERKFSAYTNLRHTVAVSSCTAALHLSLIALNIGPGDEVITTPMTFVATATAICHSGATPIFVDVDESTGLIDPNRVEDAITPRTKAVIPVHLYGSMADMRAIRRLADKYHLSIIEDCAHCIEGERDGLRPGQLSDAACYSFYATKNLTCGEGGAVATNSGDIADKIRCLRTHGLSTDAAMRYGKNYQHWDMPILGWKYNLDSIRSALLVDQVDRIDDQWLQRQSVYREYVKQLSQSKKLTMPAIVGKSGLHLFTIWVNPADRDSCLSYLKQNDIGIAVNYRAIHTLSYFQQTYHYTHLDFPVAYRIGKMTISLPFYPQLTPNEISHVCRVVNDMPASNYNLAAAV